MRVETIPIWGGILVMLVGGAVAADAWGDQDRGPLRERRRRIRTAIDRRGEQLVGVGTVVLGAALVGGDVWRFGTLAMLIGVLLLVWGGIRNWDYIKEILIFRGASRRGMERPIEKPARFRIR